MVPVRALCRARRGSTCAAAVDGPGLRIGAALLHSAVTVGILASGAAQNFDAFAAADAVFAALGQPVSAGSLADSEEMNRAST